MFPTFFTSLMIVMNQVILVMNLSPTRIIIDVDQGISLHQIGLYAQQLEESVLHIFIPFNNHCIDYPNSNLCEYIQSTSPNIVEVGTILPFEHITSAKYDRNNISNIINADIRRILYNRQIEEFITETKSIVYFIDNNFYVTGNFNRMTTSKLALDLGQPTELRHVVSPATLVLKQIFNDRIGYEFLTNEQIAELLTLPLLSGYKNFDVNHIPDGLDIFKKMIVGQSVYALKSCSIVQDDQSSRASSCLAISTLFRRIPVGSLSIYTVYHLIPLPIVINEQKYVYSTLPKILGINSIDKTVIKWSENEFESSCVSSNIIQCREYQMSIPLSSVACISNILGGVTQDSYNKCEVTRSHQSQPSIMNLENNLWLFYSNNESYDCLLHSTTGANEKTVTITEPTIIQIPCDQTIHCSGIYIPSKQCTNLTVTIKTINSTNTIEHFFSMISLKTLTKRLVSIYETAAENSFIQLESKIQANDFSFKKISKNFLSLIISSILLILFGILLLIFKYLEIKIQKQVNKLQIDVNKLRAEYIDELLSQ